MESAQPQGLLLSAPQIEPAKSEHGELASIDELGSIFAWTRPSLPEMN